jgi:hypothetical protein
MSAMNARVSSSVWRLGRNERSVANEAMKTSATAPASSGAAWRMTTSVGSVAYSPEGCAGVTVRSTVRSIEASCS